MLNHNQNKTGGLAGVLDINFEARIMLTLNVHLYDRLVNGQLGVVKHISTDTKRNTIKGLCNV